VTSPVTSHAAFDRIAPHYRYLWDDSDAGRLQRNAVWRFVQPLLRVGDRILDLGCGTGEDAVRFARHGVRVTGIDASAEMVRIARSRGVDARVHRIEESGDLQLSLDGAISIFGALNCVPDLSALREPLAEMIAPGGYLAICVMGRFCLWETIWYLLHGDPRKAARRWKGRASSSLGLKIYYPSMKEITNSFAPAFRLVSSAGIGILVPPSFVRGLSNTWLRRFDTIDRRIAACPAVAGLGDHRILVFRRV